MRLGSIHRSAYGQHDRQANIAFGENRLPYRRYEDSTGLAKQPLELRYASDRSQVRRDWKDVIRSAVWSGTILFGGLLLIFVFLTPPSLQAGSIHPLCGGYCGVSIQAQFHSIKPDSDRHWFVTLSGETPLAWKWLIPAKWSYEQMSLNWQSYDDNPRGSGSLKVKLPSMEYSSAGASGVLSKGLLSTWLTGQPVTKTDTCDENVEAVFQFLQAAANGTLPTPRHHTYRPPGSVQCTIQHGLLGSQFPLLPIVGWLLVWCLWFRPRLPRQDPTDPPGTAEPHGDC